MKLSEEEVIILNNTDKKYEYIARDENGELFIYAVKPYRREDGVFDTKEYQVTESLNAFKNIFKNIKWEDEPFRYRYGDYVILWCN